MRYRELMYQWRHCHHGLTTPARIDNKALMTKVAFSILGLEQSVIRLPLHQIVGCYENIAKDTCWSEIATTHADSSKWFDKLQLDPSAATSEIASIIRPVNIDNQYYVSRDQLHLIAILRVFFGANPPILFAVIIRRYILDQNALASYKLLKKKLLNKEYSHLTLDLVLSSFPPELKIRNQFLANAITISPANSFELLYGVKGKKWSRYREYCKRPSMISRLLGTHLSIKKIAP